MDKEIKEEFRLMRVFIRDIRENLSSLEKKLIEINKRLEEVESNLPNKMSKDKPFQ